MTYTHSAYIFIALTPSSSLLSQLLKGKQQKMSSPIAIDRNSDSLFIGNWLWKRVGSKPAALQASKKPSATVVQKNRDFHSEIIGVFVTVGEKCYFIDRKYLDDLPANSFGDSVRNKVHMNCPLTVPPEVTVELNRRAGKKNFDAPEYASESEEGEYEEDEEGVDYHVEERKRPNLPLLNTQLIPGQTGVLTPATPGPDTANMPQPSFPGNYNYSMQPMQQVKRPATLPRGKNKKRVKAAPYPTPAKKRMCLTPEEARVVQHERERQAMARSMSYDEVINSVAHADSNLTAEDLEDRDTILPNSYPGEVYGGAPQPSQTSDITTPGLGDELDAAVKMIQE
jgi:hypothetical protein